MHPLATAAPEVGVSALPGGLALLPLLILWLSWWRGATTETMVLFGIGLVWLLSPLFRPAPDDSSLQGHPSE